MKLTKHFFSILILLTFSQLCYCQFYNELFKVYNRNNKLELIEALETKLNLKNKKLVSMHSLDSSFNYNVRKQNITIYKRNDSLNSVDSLMIHITDHKIMLIVNGKTSTINYNDTINNKTTETGILNIDLNTFVWGNWLFEANQKSGENFRIIIRNLVNKKYTVIERNHTHKQQKMNFWRVYFCNTESNFIEIYSPKIGIISFKNEKYGVYLFGNRYKNKFRSISTYPTNASMILDDSFQLRYNKFGKLIKKKSRGINVINL